MTAAMQQLIAAYGEGPVYAAAGGAAVFCALKLSLSGGGAGKPSHGLTLDPALEYKCKEVANPGTKGWGYSGVRFERCEDDSGLLSRSNLLVIGSLSAASWVAVYALVELGRTAVQLVIA